VSAYLDVALTVCALLDLTPKSHEEKSESTPPRLSHRGGPTDPKFQCFNTDNRDMKTANILLDVERRPKIVDYDMTRFFNDT
jgi:hypothetical protein